MKAYLVLLAGVFISTIASADVVATARLQQSNSDVIVVSITNELPAGQYCAGLAASAVISSPTMDFNLGNGCWTFGGNDFISLELYANSDGREMSFPVGLGYLLTTPEFKVLLDAANQK